MKLIDIIIVNYFSTHKIKGLLESIYNSNIDQALLNVIIISNSNEQELHTLHIKSNTRIITNAANIGFGNACNKAATQCNSELILLLNPDTCMFKNTISGTLQFMSQNKDVTVLGVKHLITTGAVAVSCSRFPKLHNFLNDIFGLSKMLPKTFKGDSLMHDWDHTSSRFVDQVMGAFMCIRRSFIDQHGFMDPRYFVFGEDMDFCKKVWENGGKVFYNADISINHEGGSTDNISHIRLCYSLEGKLKYAYKHLAKVKYYILLSAVILIEPLTRIVFALSKGNVKLMKETVKGYYMFYNRRHFT